MTNLLFKATKHSKQFLLIENSGWFLKETMHKHFTQEHRYQVASNNIASNINMWQNFVSEARTNHSWVGSWPYLQTLGEAGRAFHVLTLYSISPTHNF